VSLQKPSFFKDGFLFLSLLQVLLHVPNPESFLLQYLI